MPLIIPVSDIRETLGVDDVPGVSKAIERTIESAQVAVENSFRSEFSRVTAVDEFFVHHSHKFGPSYQNLFLLSRGLIDTGASITAYAAGTRAALSDATARTNLASLAGVDYTHVEPDTGLFQVTELDLSSCYVRISYTAGLTDDDADPPIYQNVPEWLRQAVRLNTMILLDAHPIIPRPTAREADGGFLQTDVVEKQLAQILYNKSRYEPAAMKPRMATAVPI